MASLRIQDENIGNVGQGGKGFRPKRAVLGTINTNVENVKAKAQPDKLLLKPKLKSALPGGKVIQPINGPCHVPFQIFQEEESEPSHASAQAVVKIKQETKCRVLKERKPEEIVPAPIPSSSHTLIASHAEYLQACKGAPEPMSPTSSIDSPMCVDTHKSELKSLKDVEAAQRELDYLNLTERLYMCEEYREDISQYLRDLQRVYRPRKNYMERQKDISHNMRCVLIDWLVEVVEEYKLTNETLYLAVSYIDRFLSSMSVIRNKLQLVGTAAMFIAAKYEEIYPPDVKDFVYITDDSYTKKQVLRMEHLILRILEFNLSVPTALNFLSDYASHYPTPDNVKYLAMYLCELSLHHGDPYLAYLPSDIAAAAMCVARAVLLPEEEVLPRELSQLMDCELVDIIYVVNALETTYRMAEGCPQQATRDKYKTDKYLKVACLPPPDNECLSNLTKSATPKRPSS